MCTITILPDVSKMVWQLSTKMVKRVILTQRENLLFLIFLRKQQAHIMAVHGSDIMAFGGYAKLKIER